MAHTDDTVLYSIDSVLYKHLNHETTEAEERRLYAWLEEREEHRTFYFEIAAIWSAHKTLSSKQLGERCDAMMRRLNARIDADEAMRREVKRRRPAWRRWASAAAAAAVVAVAVTAAWFASIGTPGDELFRTYLNESGEIAALRLEDGTQVWMQDGTELQYAVGAGSEERIVRIDGEAYFDVAHDASRRFVVHADTVSVSVYGTAFNISSYADEGAIETTLVRGSVEVRSGHRRAMLQPGQQARVGREGAIFDVRQVAAEDYAAWTRGLFTFNDETIASICRKLSRWYGVEIVPRGVDADKVRYTGVVKRYETFAEMARLLARTDQIRADVEEGKIVLCIDRDDD